MAAMSSILLHALASSPALLPECFSAAIPKFHTPPHLKFAALSNGLIILCVQEKASATAAVASVAAGLRCAMCQHRAAKGRLTRKFVRIYTFLNAALCSLVAPSQINSAEVAAAVLAAEEAVLAEEAGALRVIWAGG